MTPNSDIRFSSLVHTKDGSSNMTTLNTICHECGAIAVRETVLERNAQLNYEGVPHDVSAVVPAYVCGKCDAIYFDYRSDDLLRRSLRDQLGLLQPEEIAALRDR